ncbi:acyl-CoA dehydrogenase family protein [Mesorhizobium sp. B4-1-4]|uniref:acyl-CoA dehydrogenase family protein n=1 Tax=Mesorhizobium sp. B4-1-4 TaxID=2589888 RepID=UPI001128E9D7|nr:acyl-CoA dehydrogenase [Mesorhizobium sp. B4-1-4]UCI31913.1 acyl-CoA dehydrogenase [Mesorhizobium sp. B4-1-4]
MDFDLSEEQTLLQDSLAKLLGRAYSFERRTTYLKGSEGWSRDVWAALAEIGVLGLPFAESDGGFGAGPVETMLVAEQLGRVLALEPWLATVVIGGGVLRHGAEASIRSDYISKVACGHKILAFASTEPQSRYRLDDVATSARKEGKAWRIDGRKCVVLHGDTADDLVVTARISGGQQERSGIGVFLVPTSAAGVSRRSYPSSDGLRAADIVFDNVVIDPEALLGTPENGIELVERVVDEAIAALAAEAVGCMQAANELTVEYLKTRKQFGRMIGSFQVLQHRAAEMIISLEQARSMAMLAAMTVDEQNVDERRRIMSAVKIEVGRSARKIGQEVVQLHGGIGMTMEYLGSHFFRRLASIETMFGDADYHLGLLARAGSVFRSPTARFD